MNYSATEQRAHFVCVGRSEVRSHMDSLSSRMDRVERELEYLENKIPPQSDIEMEEALLEQQIKAAELEQMKKKAKIKVQNGRKCVCWVCNVCVVVKTETKERNKRGWSKLSKADKQKHDVWRNYPFTAVSPTSSDCRLALSDIKSLKIVKKAGDAHGSWFKDTSEGSAKVSNISVFALPFLSLSLSSVRSD